MPATCGTLSNGTCNPAAPLAPKCPVPMLSGVTFRPCCVIASNLCGIDATSLGMGCVSLSNIPGLDPGIPPTHCDGTRAQ